jgi:hypothetical protein
MLDPYRAVTGSAENLALMDTNKDGAVDNQGNLLKNLY